MEIFKALLRDDRGATAAEYAIILAIIGGAIAVGSLALGGAVSQSINRSAGEIRNCGGDC
jgi:pilus assembly protein Flp/PilA